MDDKQMKQIIAEYWDNVGEEYDTYPRHGIHSLNEEAAWKKALEQLMPSKSSTILDVGAGTGFLTLLLADMGHRVKCTDISDGMLKVAKMNVAKKKLEEQVSFLVCDAEQIAEEDASFDVVVSRHLFWTLPHPEKAVREWLRVTKEGGRVVIIDADWYFEDSVITEEMQETDRRHNYSEDVEAMLPLVSGRTSSEEYLKKHGYFVKKYALSEVEEIEQDQVNKHAGDDINTKKRFVYVIDKL